MLIGIDIGYGYTKVVTENNNKAVFPSLVTRGHDRQLAAAWSQGNKDLLENLHIKIIEPTGYKEYFVGKLAEKQLSSSFILDDNKLNLDETHVLLATGLTLFLPEGKHQVKVATGLPLEQYVHQKEQFESLLKTFSAEVFYVDFAQKKYIEISDFLVFPQAAGAIYYVMMSDPQKYMIENSYVGLIDIGFKTTDFVAFSVNDTFSLEEELSGTVDIGMSDMLVAADRLYTERTGGSKLATSDLLALVRKGKIFYQSQYLDITRELADVREYIARTIQNKVKGVWAEKFNLFSTIFVSGGGGIDLFTYFKAFHPRVTLVEDAQMANAKGFLKVAMSRLK